MSVFYFAYGSNLDPARMRKRCPSARKVGPLTFNNAALVFRAVADVELRKGSTVQGGVWEISERDERVLDTFEGVSSGIYSRWHVTRKIEGKERRILFYKMNDEGVLPPTPEYIDTIMRGYQAFGLDLKPLDDALAASYDDRSKTDQMRTRYKRDRVRAKRDHIKNIVKPQPKLIVPAVRDNQLGLGLIEPPRLIRAKEPVRYIKNIDGTTREIKKAKEYMLPEYRDPIGVTKVVRAKRHNKGKGRNYKLSMRGW
jgi:gamma-glutamylcyclotransferase (GGCT)/AIG2-like uncharacterized protein YtfP